MYLGKTCMTIRDKNIQRPDAIFFDWDGTLVDSYSFLDGAHSHVLGQLGFQPFQDGEFKQYFGQPREILYRTIYKDKFEDAKILFETYVMKNNHKIKFLEGADKMLSSLKDMNIAMGIVSNKKRSFIEKEIENFGWCEYFVITVGAGEASEDKPSGAPLILALEKAEIPQETHNIWYVGDTENDLLCAQNAQCEAVFIKGHHDTNRLILDYNPLLSIDNCKELHDFLVAI